MIPDEAALENYLDGIYWPQINVTFDCSMKKVDPMDFDVENGASFPAPVEQGNGYPVISHDGMLQANAKGDGEANLLYSAYTVADVDINLYVVGGVGFVKYIRWNNEGQQWEESLAKGISHRDLNKCIAISSSGNPDKLFSTIAHELGHVIVDNGHHDDKCTSQASLWPQKDHRITMLMCSGEEGRTGNRMIKKEWDLAEEWLKANPDKRVAKEQQGGGN